MPIIITYEVIEGVRSQIWTVLQGVVTTENYYAAVDEMEQNRANIDIVVIEVKKGVGIAGHWLNWLKTVLKSPKPIPTYIYGDLKNRWVIMALAVIKAVGIITEVADYNSLTELLRQKYNKAS